MHQQAPARTVASTFDAAKIDAIFARLDGCHRPGAAVGIALHGKPVYRKAFGLANMELPIALSPTMRMRIGSTTKHFVCLAYMLLCEEGRASLDDRIGTFLPELNPVSHDVTVRQLMGHVSGLRDAVELSWYFSGTGHAVTRAQLLALYRDIDTVNFAPGTRFAYNNGGYLLLSAAIERITGSPLEEVLRTRIFQPLGLHDTQLRPFDTDFTPNSATLHMVNGKGGFEKSYLGTALSGEGGMVSTVDDLLRWLAHMDRPVVGTPATWALMKTPQRLLNGVATGYGLGLISELYRNVETLSHAGGVMGGNSQMLKVPAAGLDVVVLVNRHDVLAMFLVHEVLDACLAGLEPANGARPAPLVRGTFRSPVTGRTVQLFEKESRQIACIDGFDVPMTAREDGRLWPIVGYGLMQQVVTVVGHPAQSDVIRLSEFGCEEEFIEVETLHTAEPAVILGRYRADSVNVEAVVEESDGAVQLRTTGPFGASHFKLECLASDVWRARSLSGMAWGGMLSFDRCSGDFSFSSTRNRALGFRRCA